MNEVQYGSSLINDHLVPFTELSFAGLVNNWTREVVIITIFAPLGSLNTRKIMPKNTRTLAELEQLKICGIRQSDFSGAL